MQARFTVLEVNTSDYMNTGPLLCVAIRYHIMNSIHVAIGLHMMCLLISDTSADLYPTFAMPGLRPFG